MGLFSRRPDGERFGAIIDIGSGSALVAIVRSNNSEPHPEIVWSTREYVLLRESVSHEQSTKNILTALMNAVVALGGEGLQALHETHSGAKIRTLQVNISAPWSYTISKTVSFEDDEPFAISRSLVTELTEAAQRKTLDDLKENEITQILGLEIIARTTTDLIANGYRTDSPFGQEVKTLSLAHVSAVAQQSLIDAITEAKEKILPAVDVEKFSFMLVFYCVMRDLFPTATEFCLVDVTYEATEIAIVRDGILRYSTHVPYGMYSLARQLSDVMSIPKEQAFQLFRHDNLAPALKQLSAGKRELVQEIFREYQSLLTNLFHQTGDSLSIPKTIYLHTDLYTEPFFKGQIDKAANTATKSTHIIHAVTGELLSRHYSEEDRTVLERSTKDTALMLSAQFFHTRNACGDFEQL